jgi:metal-responsive CopG/Arc/MetJ family transcriptional regulator
MKSILLKIDDGLLKETDKQVKATKMSRSGYIKAAIEQYNAWQKKKELEAQLAREVQLLKANDPDKELKNTAETASLTDLQNYLND